MKRSAKTTRKRVRKQSLPASCQWGEPPDGESSFVVVRIGAELEITAAMPSYLSDDHPCDFIRQYELARKNRAIGKQRAGKDSPHIRFANAENDDELIEFARSFGPVVSKRFAFVEPPRRSWSLGDPPPEILMRARQNLQELKSEQKIYKAALCLATDLAKDDVAYDFDSAKHQMLEIARGIRDWPRQWNRERKARGVAPLWRVRGESIQRITALANSKRDLLLPPQLDARIVICELVNVFPLRAFPNAAEMLSYIRFGIRPLLYNILRREFLQAREVGVCANTHCRSFFEVERAGQRFCDDVCSRQHRQREYWEDHGKTARRERLGAQSKRRNVKLPRTTSPGRAI